MEDLQLSEIPMEKGIFTWWNKRSGADSVHAKLDRGFSNISFKQLSLNYHITLIHISTSDDHILKPNFQAPAGIVSCQKSTRMEPWWFSHS